MKSWDSEIDSQSSLILEHFLFWLNLVYVPQVPVHVSSAVKLPLAEIAMQLWSSMACSHVVRYVRTPAEPGGV